MCPYIILITILCLRTIFCGKFIIYAIYKFIQLSIRIYNLLEHHQFMFIYKKRDTEIFLRGLAVSESLFSIISSSYFLVAQKLIVALFKIFYV